MDSTHRVLKSTHRQTEPSNTEQGTSTLPPGWTEHRAPTGHLYYYNATTKQSTYTRPAQTPQEVLKPIPVYDGGFNNHYVAPEIQHRIQADQRQTYRHDRGRGNHSQNYSRREPPKDRPKHKQTIPGAEPWLLIRTKLRRRFVHNPKTGESLWKFPADVMQAVVDLDRSDRERKERHEQGVFSVHEEENKDDSQRTENGARKHDEDSDEYEEVEVTDESDDDGTINKKRQRLNDSASKPGPVEFGEDDIAFQLAQMESQEEGSDNELYEDTEEAQLSAEDARALFKDLLDDFKISPFTPWETIIAEGKIIDDARYTILPNTRTRREVFDEWAREKAILVREERARQAQQDPRLFYLELLSEKATPKLYWPEFRRKYQKEPAMKDRKLMDKEREKLYRDLIKALKTSESDRKNDLRRLLEEIPANELNRTTAMSALPTRLRRDLRYIALSPKVRDPFIEGYIASAAPPEPPPASKDQDEDQLSPEEIERRQKAQLSRQRREKALAERERAVQERRSQQRRELAYSKGLLREEEAHLRRAMNVDGRDGLLSHMPDTDRDTDRDKDRDKSARPDNEHADKDTD